MKKLTRRDTLALASSLLAAGTHREASGEHGEILDIKFDPYELTPEREALHTVRFPRLDQDSTMDFLRGFKKWNAKDRADRKAIADHNAYLEGNNLPTGDTDLGFEESFNVMLGDPSFAARIRLYRSGQGLMWDRAFRAFHQDADTYLKMLEETDRAGPGSLELNPDMDLPDYTRHEIHTQPGGYVGDPFAGWAYHWALSQAFYGDRYPHDEIHLAIAQNCPLPADGKVERILDVGCGSGLSTMAYKERFPQAEVWGIDAGGPMVRYAHHCAVKRNIDVNFAQRLVEDNKFPDGYFDIVSNYIMFHEVSAEAAPDAVGGISRVLRPGGIYNHVDTVTVGEPDTGSPSFLFRLPRTILNKANAWQNHRHNFEPWFLEYSNSDFPALLRSAGLDVDMSRKSNGTPFPRLIGTKRA